LNKGETAMPNIDDEARELARKHYQIEDGVTQIIRIIDCAYGAAGDRKDNRIILLEVNENTISSGIMPLQFAPLPAAGIHYPSIIVEVTPEEFDRIRSQELKLPAGWKLGGPIPREEVGAAP
jgi:hypothetical protein